MLQIHEISQRPAVQAVQAVQAELVAAAYPHSTVVLLAELVPLAVKLCQEQPVHLAAPVLEPSVLLVQVAVWRPTRLAVRAELVLALLVLPAALVLLARRELQEPGVRPERERPEQQPWW